MGKRTLERLTIVRETSDFKLGRIVYTYRCFNDKTIFGNAAFDFTKANDSLRSHFLDCVDIRPLRLRSGVDHPGGIESVSFVVDNDDYRHSLYQALRTFDDVARGALKTLGPLCPFTFIRATFIRDDGGIYEAQISRCEDDSALFEWMPINGKFVIPRFSFFGVAKSDIEVKMGIRDRNGIVSRMKQPDGVQTIVLISKKESEKRLRDQLTNIAPRQ